MTEPGVATSEPPLAPLPEERGSESEMSALVPVGLEDSPGTPRPQEAEERSAGDTETLPDEPGAGGGELDHEPEHELTADKNHAKLDEGEGLAAGLS